ncbi:hypothetical protein SAMN05443668_103126 [Cryptosporangium aurantiacum]|uniref:Uncharacterized protein n=1 Tax=Cryptosporangium aurantiacum TaxID=134849 RepID=A0A1M7PAR2_9ACTN|nr:hypothetical protein [Cryptosporangium aurantiacum]SHN13851.1 hypothetical protein SAMN05443668_103126 [Cryptosporangium aurantiacum]
MRAYLETLLPAVLDGTVEPGKVFDHMVSIEETSEATGRWTSATRSRF